MWELGIGVFGGYDFSQAIWEVGGASISVALLATVAAVVWIVGTNDGDRCQHPRRANEDLCRAVHQPMYERGSHVRLVEVADEPE